MKEILVLMLVVLTWSLLLMLARVLWGHPENLQTLVQTAILSGVGTMLALHEILHPAPPKDDRWHLHKSG